MDFEEEQILKKIKQHRSFNVSESEYYEIDGLPIKLERDIDNQDDHSFEKDVKKLERVAIDNDDFRLKNLIKDLKKSREN